MACAHISTNVRDVVSGGCCTWYDEPDMLTKVENDGLWFCRFVHFIAQNCGWEGANDVLLCVDALHPRYATALCFRSHNSLLIIQTSNYRHDLLVDRKIQNRLGNTIPSMQKDLSLPDGKSSQFRMTQSHRCMSVEAPGDVYFARSCNPQTLQQQSKAGFISARAWLVAAGHVSFFCLRT